MGLENMKEAKIKAKGALNDVTKLTSVKDSHRLQIDYYCDPDLVRVEINKG